MKATTIKPRAFASKTNAQLSDQNITYNEAGKTYNEADLTYGGVYGEQDKPMIVSSVKAEKPKSSALSTDARLHDDGITYNEPDLTYNSELYAYGGLYGEQNVFPLVARVYVEKPSIVHFGDIYTPGVQPGDNSGMLIGMLGMTYP